jgi:tetratricopeptide (TPR) repeat protein
MATNGRDIEVLRAYDEGRFSDVLDICDDVIESRAYELDELLGSSKSTSETGHSQHRQNVQLELYLFHRNMKAAVLNRMGKWSDAVRVAEETVRLTKGKDRDALCLQGTALNALGNSGAPEKAREYNKQALKCFEMALNLLPPGSHDLETSLNHATLLLKLGHVNEALDRAQSALNHLVISQHDTNSKAPNQFDDDPFADLEEVQNQSNPDGEQHDPLAYRQSGLDRDHIRFDPDLHILVAAIYNSMNQYESVIAQCMLGVKSLKRKGALESPLLSRFYEFHFSACIRLNRLAEAELVAKMLTKIHPKDLQCLEKYFKLMVRNDKSFEQVWAVLEEYSERLARDASSLVVVLEYKLMCLHQFGQSLKSLPVADALLKLGPHHLGYRVKAVTLLKLNRPQETLEACDEAMGYGFEENEILLSRALALEALQRWEEATEQFEAIITANPSFGPAHFHYANSLARLGRNEEALVGYDRAIELESSEPQPKLLLAKATLLRSMGRLKEAIETYHLLSKIDDSILPDVVALAKSFKKDNPAAFASPEFLAKVHDMQQSLDYQSKIPGSLVHPSSI